MLYRIGNKYYVKVQGYYKEVDLKVNGDNLEITPNGNEIEVTNVSNVEALDMNYHKENIMKAIEKRNKKSETFETTKKYHKYESRM